MKYENIEDCLTIGVDFNAFDNSGCLVVTRRKGEDVCVINMIRDDEALEIYNKLIGNNDLGE